MMTLRLNQGDRSESRVYYGAHFVAEALGFFAEEGVAVAFDWAKSGGSTTLGGQLPAVIDGSADLAIGGPMVVMRMVEEAAARKDEPVLAAFCAAASGNPWVLVAASLHAGFELADLAGRRVLDMARIGTATLTFHWVLRQHGVTGVDLLPGSGDMDADLAALAQGDADFGLHSLHALGPAIADGRVAQVGDLARLTGPVPWSAYVARRDRLAADAPAFRAFTRAIGRALRWIAARDPDEIAAVLAPYYPGYPGAGLRTAIAGYKASGVFATTPLIARADHDHFAAIMAGVGWLAAPVPYEAVVDPAFALAAG